MSELFCFNSETMDCWWNVGGDDDLHLTCFSVGAATINWREYIVDYFSSRYCSKHKLRSSRRFLTRPTFFHPQGKRWPFLSRYFKNGKTDFVYNGFVSNSELIKFGTHFVLTHCKARMIQRWAKDAKLQKNYKPSGWWVLRSKVK